MLLNTNKHGVTETKDVRTVNNCVSYHMRTEQMAINDLRKDLKIFEDYANFDSKDINTIKTKKKITDGVDL